eukprot:s775_g8.t1
MTWYAVGKDESSSLRHYIVTQNQTYVPARAGKGQLVIFMPGRCEERTEVLKALLQAFSGRLLLSTTTSFHVPRSQDLERQACSDLS